MGACHRAPAFSARPAPTPLFRGASTTPYMNDRVLVPRLYLAWPTVPRFHTDEAPLAILSDILGNGKSSRLHRALVYERRVAQSVRVHHDAAEIAGDFEVEITAAEGHIGKVMEEAVRTELERIQHQPPSPEEISRARNRLEWNHVRQMSNIGGFGGKANRLNFFNVFAGDPVMVNHDIERFLAVVPDDVSRVANAYLTDHRVQLLVLPEPPLTHGVSDIDRNVRPTPASLRQFAPPAPQRHRLSNGLELLVVEKRAIPMVAFGVVLTPGAARDPVTLPGLSAFTTTMLQEGTTSRSSSQIAEEFEFIGSQLTASAGRELTIVGTETLTRQFPKALELVSDLLQNPTFPEGELERVGNERLTALRRLRDDATTLAGQVAPALLYGRESPYGHPINGTLDIFEALSRDDLVEYFQGTYRPENTTLAVVGDVSLEEVVKLAESYLQGWKGVGQKADAQGETPNTPRPDATSLYLLDKPDAAQSVIRAGFIGVPRQHPDYFALTLLNHLFGGQFTSRLNMNLRQDKGYSYGYRSWIEWHRQSSLLLAGGSVQTAVTREAVMETLREFDEIRGERPVGEEEFLTTRAAILRQFPSSFQTCWQGLEQLTQMVLFDLPVDYYQTFSTNVEAVSLADVQRVAEERVESQRLILVVGDHNEVGQELRALGLPMRLVDAEGRAV